MRISDWSSDVCSSDLVRDTQGIFGLFPRRLVEADQASLVARRIFGKPANRDHCIEQRHVGAIRKRRRLFGRTDNANLLRKGASKIIDDDRDDRLLNILRSEEHTSELQSLMRITYDVFCLKKKNKRKKQSLGKLTTNNKKQTNT